MKARKSILSRLGWIMTLFVVLVPAVKALAQDNDLPSTALSGAVIVVSLVVCFGFYVYFSLALQTIAKKTNTENGWMAWIPIANAFLALNIAKKPLWWFLLFLIPLVGIVFEVIVAMAIAERRGKPSWWGILIIVPFGILIVPGYLAWSD